MEKRGLSNFKWRAGAGASEIAALMLLMAISHRVKLEDGIARSTYDELINATGISRTKVADGLEILVERNLVVREPSGRSTYQLQNYGDGHRWAALPAKPLYNRNGIIPMFNDFRLRNPVELNALKIYLALAARRDTSHNETLISYETIENYTSIHLSRIRSALSLLIVYHLISVQHSNWRDSPTGSVNCYKILHLPNYFSNSTADQSTQRKVATANEIALRM